MEQILLSRPILPTGFIDVSVGEAHVVRETLLKVFDLSTWELPKINGIWEYPEPKGYKLLVKLLEDKYQAPVIITTGAKQALGATFFALQQMGKKYLGMRNPYWALIPPLAKMHGLECLNSDHDCYLSISPNNPDGFMPDIKAEAEAYKDINVPFIHDAVYYNRVYMSATQYPVLGDVQIYSASKAFGLSGLRVGWAVCPNKEFYNLIMQYMEAQTVGVSIVSQIFLFDLMNRMVGYPSLTSAFEGQAAMALEENKKIIKQVSPEILDIPADIETSNGMFGWFKVGAKADFIKSKVNFIDGSLFGMPGYVRMNLALPAETIREIVSRLNSAI